ncbi:molybdopterin synthase catalytic subunit-like [Amphibalanus amphitrite]|uniref:molybdopterin synthase catalytic subunit-like n=1 Tax=Amphibalanus amphitrite TaxID=1232801 RepID=UPI001C915889|nr:molybdopterin synthase catalytic subunit-like [Amphibalanus amphitrite]XP_043241809.1 molybdopterin synthase catalytic subunit-like [Amphibalanus amphitrite]XP_043241810.1 molybdopterin synthase catalytic subunit-like [Amphibalanus amphitrite]XP_043241811.1 molybdopterin synthase catalytic subunit-like [Amphibalanus amphitrite]XP_043241812.1 molybdopterin synthase catalytic subunit-like [Amphibalanus amphitrite]XP_043241813.1 molybdopterin synthase catalytic subunit-like [Amphibalanus amphi
MDILRLTNEPLSLESISKEVGSDDCGAISSFCGTTRNSFEDRQVVRLEYEAYEEMAVSEMKKICGALREKWSLKHIAIYHRLGVVPVGESSIIIAISSCHRRDSLEAVAHAIDALKARVPIWKREVYAEGAGAEWKQNAECHWRQKAKGS